MDDDAIAKADGRGDACRKAPVFMHVFEMPGFRRVDRLQRADCRRRVANGGLDCETEDVKL